VSRLTHHRTRIVQNKPIAEPAHSASGEDVEILQLRVQKLESELKELKALRQETNTKQQSEGPPPPQYQPPPVATAGGRPPLNPILNSLDADGAFPLYGPASGGDYDRTKQLLEAGADASMRTAFGWTALHWAAKDGHVDVVRLLLEYGADVNAVSDTGEKPLGMAKGEEIREMMLARGATK
jgi:hypothetical protein